MNSHGKILLVFAVIALSIVLSLVFIARDQTDEPTQSDAINSFEDCAAAGNPIAESYPEQCFMPDGRVFVREIN